MSIPLSWTLQPTYPRRTVGGGQSSVQYRYMSKIEPELAQLQSIAATAFDGNLLCSAISASPEINRQWWYIDVTFSSSGTAEMRSRDDGDPLHLLQGNPTEIPVDSRKTDGTPYFTNYKTNWNNHLAAVDGSAVPAWWSTATDEVTGDVDYRWLKDASGLPDGWVILKNKTKRVEAVLAAYPQVSETKWYRSEKIASANANPDPKVEAPAKTFNRAGGQWLKYPSDISPDGARWRVETMYAWAEQWDSDIYS